MNKNMMSYVISFVLIIAFFGVLFINKNNKELENYKELEGTILAVSNDCLYIKDKNDEIHYISHEELKDIKAGQKLLMKYIGIINKNTCKQSISIIDYSVEDSETTISLDNDNMFSNYNKQAYEILKNMTIKEKISQLLLVKVPTTNQIEVIKNYQFGGYLLYERDFKNKTKLQVQEMINSYQKEAKIPMLMAVDEEGGDVVRISSNPNIIEHSFLSPRELYIEGGMELIRDDTVRKSKLLSSLGINLNLAPVVDVSTNPNDYIYKRTLGEHTDIVMEYSKNVIEASKGHEVSYTLKHFPGYGNNLDTHLGVSFDNRTLYEIKEINIPPFKTGIESGAEAVLISHNVVTSIDNTTSASLSNEIHDMLKNDLNFKGIIITDDLSMTGIHNTDAISKYVKAITSGNDLLIVTDYEEAMRDIMNAVTSNKISEELIDEAALKIISWKYYKGMIISK